MREYPLRGQQSIQYLKMIGNCLNHLNACFTCQGINLLEISINGAKLFPGECRNEFYTLVTDIIKLIQQITTLTTIKEIVITPFMINKTQKSN